MGNKTINKKLDIMLWKYKSIAKKKEREKSANNSQVHNYDRPTIIALLSLTLLFSLTVEKS